MDQQKYQHLFDHLQQLRQLHDQQQQLQQHRQSQQHFNDVQHSQYMQHFLDRRHFLYGQHIEQMKVFMDMQYFTYAQLYQLLRNSSEPQPQSMPEDPVPRPSNHSERYVCYGVVLRHGIPIPVMVKTPSTSNADQDSRTSRERNRSSDVQRDVLYETELQDSIIKAKALYQSLLDNKTISGPAVNNALGTSTADSCTSQEESRPIPDHHEDEAVNTSRDDGIS